MKQTYEVVEASDKAVKLLSVVGVTQRALRNSNEGVYRVIQDIG
jgi:hypothetical protein